MKKRIMSIVLVAVMMLVLLPTFSANAASSDAIEIYTAEDLDAVRYDLTADYVLMNDIDLSQSDEFSESWLPLGCDGVYRLTEKFSGTFDGNGYSISGLVINVPDKAGNSTTYGGLFAKITGTVCNLCLTNVSIENYYASYVGSIAGHNNGDIYNCSIYGDILSEYNRWVSTITGYNNGNISCCVNFANIRGTYVVSGIADCNDGTISNCYNVGNVKSARDAAGICGYNNGTIENCYNVGQIISGGNYFSYPIAYNQTGTNNKAKITNSYYLKGTAGTTSNTGVMVLSESGMKNQKAYKGFDFENVWEIDSTAEYKYPTLRNVTYLPYYNSDSSEYYKELSSAINNAKSGETIKVMDDAEIYNVSLDEGVTLDLNGHIITANRFVGYNGSAIIDSSSAKTGRIYAEKSKVIVAKNNPQLPVYDNANKCFAFAEIKTKSSDNSDRFRLDKGDDKYTYSISPVFGESANARTLVHDLIATYGEDSGVSVEILISWKNDTLTENRSYIYNIETVKSIVRSFSDNNYSRKFIASFKWANIADANNASICAVIRSSTGAEIRSAVIDIVA